jgi:hypothetical protein
MLAPHIVGSCSLMGEDYQTPGVRASARLFGPFHHQRSCSTKRVPVTDTAKSMTEPAESQPGGFFFGTV